MERQEITKHGVALTINKPMAVEARIAGFETNLGRRLPEEYREFLLLYNGGRPKPSAFQFALRTDPDAASLVNWFFSLYDGEYSNLEKNIEILTQRIPSNTIPIADDPFGNILLLGLDGEVKGKVFFWDHENEPASQPDWSNVELVADSFDAFMRGLKPA